MSSALTSKQLLQNHFTPLSGLPCWGVHQGYGSFVTMEFGEPHLDIREGTPQSKLRSMQRRIVTVYGEFHLWIEQCCWSIVEDDKEIAMSESDTKTISMALARIDSQLLKEIHLDPANGTSCLQFEHQMSFNMSRYSDSQPDDQIWHLYSPGQIISFIADGRIQYGGWDEKKPESIACRELRLSI